MIKKIILKIKKLLGLDHSLDEVHQELLNLRQIFEDNLPNVRKSEEMLLNLARTSPNPGKTAYLFEQIDLSKSQYKLLEFKTIEAYEKDLQAIDPKIFPIYKELFENGKRAYEETVEGNLSNWDSIYSVLFERFVFNYLSGRVLDIGCGTRNKPIYLSGYPDVNISAIEPLKLEYKPRFEVVRGFCEFLPWNDNSFSTAIAATSFDHVLSLDKSLKELKRVLLPDGLFLVWISSIPGAKEYNPRSNDFKAEDEFHLFHFDHKWFEPLMLEHGFEIVDKTKIPQKGFDHIFYCFQSKK